MEKRVTIYRISASFYLYCKWEQFVLVQSTGSHSLRGAGEGGGYPNVIMGDALVAFKVKNEVK